MPEIDIDRLREIRVTDPDAICRAAAERRRRPLLDDSGKLMIIAADHTGRGTLTVRGDPLGMANRAELLDHLVTALGRPGVDGVLATADVVEDLLLLGVLDDKIVIGSMNRGGLHSAPWAIDDRFTGFDVPGIVASGLDGGKMLLRMALDDPATPAALEACGQAVTALAAAGLMALVEPFMARRIDGRVRTDLSLESVIRSVTIASALGRTSARTWLKLPVVQGMERVMQATTLPALLLGGDPDPDETPDETFAAWDRAMHAPGVRGLVVGRSLLYPADGDVAAAVDRAVALVERRAKVA